ncbi:MAG: TlpA family protein disulfide reductase [Acidobacteriota bacterium]
MAFLTTTCPYCEASIPVWSELAEDLSHAGIPFVGVSLHSLEQTRAFQSSQSIQWPLWVLSNPSEKSDLKVRSVPLTVLVGEDGQQMVAVWVGALKEQDVEEISERALKAQSDAPALGNLDQQNPNQERKTTRLLSNYPTRAVSKSLTGSARPRS